MYYVQNNDLTNQFLFTHSSKCSLNLIYKNWPNYHLTEPNKDQHNICLYPDLERTKLLDNVLLFFDGKLVENEIKLNSLYKIVDWQPWWSQVRFLKVTFYFSKSSEISQSHFLFHKVRSQLQQIVRLMKETKS